MEIQFADRAKRLKASAIRNKLFDDASLISFSAGKPEPGLFPTEEMEQMLHGIITQNGRLALQYSSSEGLPALRQMIASERMKACGVHTTADNITLTSGSQEAIELSARIFLNEGDAIACESPSYTGAFNAFAPYGPRYVPIPMDENGMDMDKLEEALRENPDIRLIYTIPDFQNPTGITMSDDRRARLAELAAAYGVPVIEDCPYGDLIYEGQRHPAVKHFDKEGWVVTLGSFSKTLCPGLRLGWICADGEILAKYTLAKQGSNLQCGTLDQYLAAEYMQQFDLPAHIREICDTYRQRRDLTLACIEKYFPEGVRHTCPHGGFFVWVELDPRLDTEKLLLDAAAKHKVVYVPGKPFFADGACSNFIRLSYSFVSLEEIDEGLRRLGECLHEAYEALA